MFMFDSRTRSSDPDGTSEAAPSPRADRDAVQLEMMDCSHPMRRRAEKFIHDRFARLYGADVRHFFRTIMSLGEGNRSIVAALGFHRAGGEPLFLEQYLRGPIEQALSKALARPCRRGTVVEVGNLAVARPGGARMLITTLTAFLAAAGFDWAVFTAVPSLRNAFSRLGIDLLSLAEARAECLPEHERCLWGKYYESRPVVVAANVHQSFDALAPVTQSAVKHGNLRRLWDATHVAGLMYGSAESLPQSSESALILPGAPDRMAS
jgi:hypothetical protein